MKVQKTHDTNQWIASWFYGYLQDVINDTIESTPVMERKHLPTGKNMDLAVLQTILLNALPAGNA